MIKFKTRKTWVLATLFIVTAMLAIFFIFEAINIWNVNKTKSLGLISLAGIVCDTGGFSILLSPQIIKIFSKKESNLTYEGIGFVIIGSILQGISVYLSL
jgi:hypothetical protein